MLKRLFSSIFLIFMVFFALAAAQSQIAFADSRPAYAGRVALASEKARWELLELPAVGGSPVDEIKRLGRPLDEGRRVADAEWLETLPDNPGEFLRLRLEAEQKRRIAMGLATGEEGDPW